MSKKRYVQKVKEGLVNSKKQYEKIQQEDGKAFAQKLQVMIKLCAEQQERISKRQQKQRRQKQQQQKRKIEEERKRAQQQQRQKQLLKKKEEQQRKKKEQQQKKEQQRKRKIQQERIKKQEQEKKKKQEELKRQKMKEQFKAKNQTIIKQIQQLQTNLEALEKIDSNLVFSQALKIIDNVKIKIKQIYQKAKQVEVEMPLVSNLGKNVGEDTTFQQPFKKLLNRITEQNIRYDEFENAVFVKDRERTMQERKNNLQTYTLPRDSVPYHQSNFYELQLTNLYQKKLQNLKEQKLQQDKYNSEKNKLQAEFKILKIKQKHINEIKILVQLQLLKPQQLQYHHFDLPRFESLMAQKSKIVKQISQKNRLQEDMSHYNKIDEQLSSILSKLNTQQFLVPYRYPLEILVKSKQDLIIDYYKKLGSGLSNQLSERKKQTQILQQKYSSLSKQVIQNQKKLQKAKLKYNQFMESSREQIKKEILLQEQKGDVIPKQIKESYKEDLKIKITNADQIKQLYAALNDHSKTKDAYEQYQQKKKQLLKVKQQFKDKSEELMKSPPQKLQNYLIKIAMPEGKQDENKQLEEQLNRLKQKCERIERAKRSKENKFKGSRIELYSSII